MSKDKYECPQWPLTDPTGHTAMASTASVLAQTRIANELARIADALERFNEAALTKHTDGKGEYVYTDVDVRSMPSIDIDTMPGGSR